MIHYQCDVCGKNLTKDEVKFVRATLSDEVGPLLGFETDNGYAEVDKHVCSKACARRALIQFTNELKDG